MADMEELPTEIRAIMPQGFRLAVLGFSSFDRATFADFFMLSMRRTPAYLQVADPAQADFLVVDADDEAIVARLRTEGQLSRCVMIGGTPQAGVALQLSRPVSAMLLVLALDALPRDTASEREEALAEDGAWAHGADFAPTEPAPFLLSPESPPDFRLPRRMRPRDDEA